MLLSLPLNHLYCYLRGCGHAVPINAPSFFENLANIIDGSIVSVPSLSPVPLVPEPASLALLSLSTLALLRRRG